ncbi:Wzz/FepE/Etk N-terminal domain-containing protein [Pseudomonas putida]|uniref:LPS O-antigen chain length determinant protein WzzB n=1 Tax=Pseudomonas putida TaxID=303 RepID=UPI002D1F8795|nr:Wzz/FepE/Etk N-terminal domain-containing protein [Pseudomonas putida]MEB3901405.1 Wzz/FepE/Etk N-terminal domain-containing protein [Pseudomonas putida]
MRNEPERLNGVDDEIDLFELIDGIWKRRLLVVVIAVIMTAIASIYVFFAEPIYEAKVFIQPPTQNDIAQLNFGRGDSSGMNMLSVKDVYGIYLQHLQSESLRREFFRKVYLPSLSEDERAGSQDELYRDFQEIVNLGVVDKSMPDKFYVKVNMPDPQQAAEWVVQYVEMAGRRSAKEVIKDVMAEASVKANNLEQQINVARESARKQREDQIAQLSEALRVAQSIGLEKPPIISNTLSSEVSAGMDGSLTYMRGSKALQAEIENLRQRNSDDPFVANLRQRQEALAFYRGLRIDPSVIQVYRQDGAIESPDKPVKPRRAFIVALGVGGGLGLGVMLAVLGYLKARVAARRS